MKRYSGRGLQGPKGRSFCLHWVRYTPPSWLVDTFQDSEALQMLYFGDLYRGFIPSVQFSSVQSLSHVWLFATHELQHARPPCPSPTPRVHSNSCPSSRWCNSAISSSVVPFSSCPQSLPSSGSFPVSQLFVWGGQSAGVSVSASVLPVKSQGWSPLGWTGWTSFAVQGTLKSLLQHHSSKASIPWCSAFFTYFKANP